MQKHTIYENQKSFVPTIATTSNLNSIPQDSVIVISQAGLTNPPAAFAAALKNQQAQNDLKRGAITLYGRSGEQFQRTIVFYSESTNASVAHGLAGKNLRQLTSEFRGTTEINLVFTDEFSQEYINEYIYSTINSNYEWQRKSQPVGQDSNTSIFKAVQAINIFSNNINGQDQQFQYLTQVSKFRLLSKELINTRCNIANTTWMAQQAIDFQKQHHNKVQIEIIRGEELVTKGLRLMHAVGRASVNEPILVILNYRGNPQSQQTTAIVGKGVVYDCGGLSLKTALTEQMHGDKGGACSVLATFQAVVELGLKVNVVCTMGLVENSISANAYRVSDIIQTYKGITVEIGNTDAEGRNVLADALSYTQVNYKPTTVIDIATLTGSCLHALGLDTGAVFGNDRNLQQQISNLSYTAHEPLHPMPITDFMKSNIISDQGDIRNSGKQPWGGAGTAAAFLEKFIEKGTNWVHFDVAQASMNKGELNIVRTLVDYFKTLN